MQLALIQERIHAASRRLLQACSEDSGLHHIGTALKFRLVALARGNDSVQRCMPNYKQMSTYRRLEHLLHSHYPDTSEKEWHTAIGQAFARGRRNIFPGQLDIGNMMTIQLQNKG